MSNEFWWGIAFGVASLVFSLWWASDSRRHSSAQRRSAKDEADKALSATVQRAGRDPEYREHLFRTGHTEAWRCMCSAAVYAGMLSILVPATVAGLVFIPNVDARIALPAFGVVSSVLLFAGFFASLFSLFDAIRPLAAFNRALENGYKQPTRATRDEESSTEPSPEPTS